MIFIYMEYIHLIFLILTTVLEQAKDHCKEIIKETKAEIAFIENPNGMYDLVMDEVLEDADADIEMQQIKKDD